MNWWHSANQSRRKGSTPQMFFPQEKKLISSSNTICFHFNAFLVGFLFVLEHILGGQWQILISHSLLWGAHKDFASLFVLPLAPDPKNERIHPNLKQKSPPCLQQQHLAPSWALFQTPNFLLTLRTQPRRVSWQGSAALIRIINGFAPLPLRSCSIPPPWKCWSWAAENKM